MLEHLRRVDLAQALEAVEQRVVLQHQVVERHADRQRDHDGVDALGAHRQPADQRGAHGGDQHRERHRHPPRPAQVDRRRAGAAGAEDAERIAGDAGHRHLRQRHHAAVATEKRERQRDQPRISDCAATWKVNERRGHEREHQHEQAARTHGAAATCATGTAASAARRCRRTESGAGRSAARSMPRGRGSARCAPVFIALRQ